MIAEASLAKKYSTESWGLEGPNFSSVVTESSRVTIRLGLEILRPGIGDGTTPCPWLYSLGSSNGLQNIQVINFDFTEIVVNFIKKIIFEYLYTSVSGREMNHYFISTCIE